MGLGGFDSSVYVNGLVAVGSADVFEWVRIVGVVVGRAFCVEVCVQFGRCI